MSFKMSFNILKSSLLLSILLSGCASDFEKRTKSIKRATSRPYMIKGICYYPQDYYELCEVGIASHYGLGDGFHGRRTSTGEIYNMYNMTGAHKTLPLPCIVLVHNLENNRKVVLKINDRGPFVDGRIIDVSLTAAKILGFYRKGTAKVKITTLVEESLLLNKQI